MLQFSPVSRNIIFICVAVFIIQKIVSDANFYLALWPFNSGIFKPYQLFSYMWAHGDFWHLFFNMMMLAFAGPTLEMVWGQQRFLLFYMISGIGAALVYAGIQFLLTPSGGIPMIGASGAIYGLLMAMSLTMPDREMNLMIPPITIKMKYMVVVFFAISLLMGGTNVAHTAHLGGAVVGFLLIKVFRF